MNPCRAYKRTRRGKVLFGSRFQAHTFVSPPAGFGHDMFEHAGGHSPPTGSGGGAHRLDLSMPRGQFLQRPASKQHAVLAGCPERDRFMRQGRMVQRVHAFCRRRRKHIRQMLAEELMNIRARGIVRCNLDHGFKFTGSGWVGPTLNSAVSPPASATGPSYPGPLPSRDRCNPPGPPDPDAP